MVKKWILIGTTLKYKKMELKLEFIQQTKDLYKNLMLYGYIRKCIDL